MLLAGERTHLLGSLTTLHVRLQRVAQGIVHRLQVRHVVSESYCPAQALGLGKQCASPAPHNRIVRHMPPSLGPVHSVMGRVVRDTPIPAAGPSTLWQPCRVSHEPW